MEFTLLWEGQYAEIIICTYALFNSGDLKKKKKWLSNYSID